MGVLVRGVWREQRPAGDEGDRFVRGESWFRNWVTADGSPGPTGRSGFKAEPGRYHLYVSPACPWSHRTILYRALKRLAALVPMTIVDWHMGREGWVFSSRDGATPDPVNGAKRLSEIYLRADPRYTGKVTVPVLFDRQERTIVSNESADIIRMFETAFDAFSEVDIDARPLVLRAEIDALNARIYETVNNGVYRAGFARSQEAYEEAFLALAESLDWLEARLARRRYLIADHPTEADWRLFPTLVRFDAVYYIHFKCSMRRLIDYPNLFAYTRDLYQQPRVAETLNLHHIKGHYYTSHPMLNPLGIVPLGPTIDFTAPHGREVMPRANAA
jgi:glutathionyl-hydroquinone reductase